MAPFGKRSISGCDKLHKKLIVHVVENSKEQFSEKSFYTRALKEIDALRTER